MCPVRNIVKKKPLIIGSRSSKLALVQANFVRDKLKVFYPGLDFEVKTIKTAGDKILDAALSRIGDKGLFTKEIEEALLKREIDLAVHSMKDLPTELPGGLKIAAVTDRVDPCDVLVSEPGFTINTLPIGSRVGTSSLRRRAQLLHMRKNLNILDLRGNLNTRVKKLEQGLYDAVILAYAGIERLILKSNEQTIYGSEADVNRSEASANLTLSDHRESKGQLKLSLIPIEQILPAAGQGALGIEIHKDAHNTDKLIKVLDDTDSHLAIDAERALLSGLEGGCQVPIGVYAQVNKDQISIKAGVFSLDGKVSVKDEITGSKKDAEALGSQLAERILTKKEARQILDEIKKTIK